MKLRHKATIKNRLPGYRALKKTQVVFGAVIFLLITVLLAGDVFSYFAGKISRDIALYQGNNAYDNGDYGDAEVYYSKALEKASPSWNISYNLANTYYQQGRFAEAVKAYQKALTLADTDHQSGTWNNLGNAYYMSGDLTKSVAAYRNALLISSDDVKTRRNYVYVLNKLQLKAGQDFFRRLKKHEVADNSNHADKKGKDDNGQKEKSGNDKNQQDYKLSNKTMNDLFSQINQNEDKVRGRISKAKLNNNTTTGEPDY